MGIIAIFSVSIISLFSFKFEFSNPSSPGWRIDFPSETEILDKGQYLMAEANLALSSSNLNIIQGSNLEAVAPPFSISGKVLGSLGLEQETEIGEYIVKSGDTLSSIAVNSGISLDTLLWANDLDKKSTISPGQKLIILPVSGVLYVVRKDDTLSQITETYGGKVDEIVAINGLINRDDIFIGDLLIIPGGKMPLRISRLALTPVSESYFIFPCEGVVTQGPHGYQGSAIDVANKCGKPVVVVAQGIVQRAKKYGWNWGYGKYVTILHPNGVVTYYAHLSKILVVPGQAVNTGDIIGYIGNTGHTIGATGCHLHFEVRGAKNFLAKYPVGTYLKWGK